MWKISTLIILAIIACSAPGWSAALPTNHGGGRVGTTYYISTEGKDNNSGRSPETPWRTLEKIATKTFQPGDSILLKSGDTWQGELSPEGNGIKGHPIVISRYGKGRKPMIHASGGQRSAAVTLHNQSYWKVMNLEVTNRQTEDPSYHLWGLKVSADKNHPVNHIEIRGCFVHDVEGPTDESGSTFTKMTGGIIFTGPTNNVLIRYNHVKNVSVEGIRNSSDIKCSHFVVDHNLVEDVYGDGIVLHGVKNGSAITHNKVRHVASNKGNANYAGVWTYLSDTTRIAYNEVFGMTGGGINDGQPFDADIHTNGDIFEYNYSHDNASGFMLLMPNAKNIIVRFNLSVNDILPNSRDRKKRWFNYTGSAPHGNKIYNNTFVLNTGVDIEEVFGGGFNGLFSNNIIYTTGAIKTFSEKPVSRESRFQNNIFFPASMVSKNGPKGMVSGNLKENPHFIHPTFNGKAREKAAKAFALQHASPGVDAGAPLPEKIRYDFAGHLLSREKHSWIGAIWGKPSPADRQQK